MNRLIIACSLLCFCIACGPEESEEENQRWNVSENTQNSEGCGIDDCEDGEYCHFDDGLCGDEGAEGVCQPLPEGCDDDFTNLCGCDGREYIGSSSCAPQHQGGVDIHSDDTSCENTCHDVNDPDVDYRFTENLIRCTEDDWGCNEGEEYFMDDCGCGCIVVEDQDCLDGDDPDVTYMANSPEACALIDYGCDEGEERFADDCGCGCVVVDDAPDNCTTEEGCTDGQFCHFDDNVCGEAGGQGTCQDLPEVCTDDIATVCGCDGVSYQGSSTCASELQGGVDNHSDLSFCDVDHEDCLDPDDPDVNYVGDSVEECGAIFIVCEDDEQLFQNDCGCGCVKN